MLIRKQGARKSVMKQGLNFKDYKTCLENNITILEPQQKFRSKTDNVFTKKMNKIALSSNDDKRLETLEKVIPYPHGTDAGRVGKTILMEYIKMKN